MKIRIAFVTNSSSTSFCCIGINAQIYQDIARQLLLAEGYDPDDEDHYGSPAWPDMSWGGGGNGRVVEFWGNDYEVSWIGINARGLLEKMTIPEAREYFVKTIKNEYNIDIPLSCVEFFYGEVGTG